MSLHPLLHLCLLYLCTLRTFNIFSRVVELAFALLNMPNARMTMDSDFYQPREGIPQATNIPLTLR